VSKAVNIKATQYCVSIVPDELRQGWCDHWDVTVKRNWDGTWSVVKRMYQTNVILSTDGEWEFDRKTGEHHFTKQKALGLAHDAAQNIAGVAKFLKSRNRLAKIGANHE
jgi:hypothetical protein